ncbi:MAG: dihydroneopterin aldolase [Elainellaceae cyanobacterium]
MDALHIKGIRAYGYIGFLPEEQTLGQWFEVDLTVWRSLSESGSSDNLSDTYDYSNSVEQVQALIQTARFKLLERLADEIARLVLQSNNVEQVRVQLTKLTPPIPNFSGHVTVDIVRSQEFLST